MKLLYEIPDEAGEVFPSLAVRRESPFQMQAFQVLPPIALPGGGTIYVTLPIDRPRKLSDFISKPLGQAFAEDRAGEVKSAIGEIRETPGAGAAIGEQIVGEQSLPPRRFQEVTDNAAEISKSLRSSAARALSIADQIEEVAAAVTALESVQIATVSEQLVPIGVSAEQAAGIQTSGFGQAGEIRTDEAQRVELPIGEVMERLAGRILAGGTVGHEREHELRRGIVSLISALAAQCCGESAAWDRAQLLKAAAVLVA